jgi:serine/threonine-protein kinase
MINDRFKIVALIARGGMGKVYRAEQAPLGRTCALKVLNPKYSGEHDPEFHKRFFLEASIASKLTHPNTVTIFDYGRTDDEIYYMAMEYLEGRTLHRAIREEGAFPEERAAHIARQVCRSLREAHSLGVIHRDLKPANIFLVEHADEHDFVKVLDFGLVKNVGENRGEDLTQAGLFMGSPKYMAPEQIKGEKVDGRTDVYALGIIMYEMITGKVPFDRPNSVHIMMAHVNEQPPPMRAINPEIQITAAIEDVVHRCLEKDPDKRPTSMENLLSALKGVGGGAMTATLSGVLGTGDFLSSSSPSGGGGALAPPSLTGSGPQQPMFLSPSTSPSQSGAFPPGDVSAVGGVSPFDVPAKKGSRGVLAVAIAGVVVAGIAGAAFIATRAGPSSAAPPTAASSAGPAVHASAALAGSEAPSATASAPAPEKVASFRVESEPSGAKVKSASGGTVLCEATPCDIKLTGDDAADGKELRITLVKDGYRDETKTIRVGDKKAEIKLARVAPVGGGGVRPPKPPVPPPPATTTAPPSGFKDIPY